MTKVRVSARLRRLVKERADSCCEYCISQEAYSPDPFSVEHIIPFNAGGNNAEKNLALACQGCNNLKYNKTLAADPITLQDAPLFNPRMDLWPEHFTWNHDFSELLGLTPTGRATIAALRLNRENIANLRLVLVVAGKIPRDTEPFSHHSHRSAVIGSTRDAFLAGRYPASAATPNSSVVATQIVSGSAGVRP